MSQKNPKPAVQIHHQELQHDRALRCARELGANTGKTVPPLCNTIRAFNAVAQACIESRLHLLCLASHFGRSAERWSAYPYASLLQPVKVLPVSKDGIGHHGFRIVPKPVAVVFHHFLQKRPFVVIVEAHLLNEAVSLNDGCENLVPKLHIRPRFPSYNRTQMRLADAHNPLIDAAQLVLVHVQLLGVQLADGL